MNSLTELKNIIQSINENITDNDIDAFQNELSQIGQQYEKNIIITSFLKMMQSLGKYLGSKKSNAHIDSIPVLNSIAHKLDKIIYNPDLEKNETDRILSKEIQKYKSLKNKIASKPEINDNDINDLKAVLLTIDWEISETTVQNFEKVVTNLLLKLKNYKIHHTFLKIIHSTGRYIGNQKANAHTDSISFLRSVFEDFEQIVQNPDMPFKDKKQALETHVNRFHEFKRKISLKKKKTHLTPDVSEDEFIQPALSHIKPAGMHAADDIAPLTTIPVETEDKSEPDSIQPALKNKNKSPAEPRDIMDDLFSGKESPADELLDAIHLMDVHGPNQGQAMNMLDQKDDLHSNGIKNFTPQRMNNDPIPEIGSRLDEFFSLDVSSDDTIPGDDKKDQALETSTIPEDDAADSIVPFRNEDKPFEEVRQAGIEDEPLPQSPEAAILSRLKSTVETAEWLQYRSSLLSINEDISYLKKYWQDDPDKTCLLQIIASIINLLKTRPETILKTTMNKTNKADNIVSDTPPEKSLGIWGKIKTMFTS
ncbi:MAG: hypothetical protein K8S18_14300 [Desulfobacula sp.]|nr:hypothetical protein [Desulfobacula sp.]